MLAWRFSPVSNEKREQIPPADELRVLVATDVLSEGQNLQDAHIVVNYDLPWAIIRLIQRAGRVDRIGQESDTILCYSFLPAEGVERIIRLRERVRIRLHQNAEVVGTDEAFFEAKRTRTPCLTCTMRRPASWTARPTARLTWHRKPIRSGKMLPHANPRLKTIIERLPSVVYSTRAHRGTALAPEGVLVYMRTGDDADALTWVNRKGENVTQSQLAILRAAECSIDEPAIPRPDEQHDLVKAARGAHCGGAGREYRRSASLAAHPVRAAEPTNVSSGIC